MALWATLCSELDHLRTLRNGMHAMMVAIGVECLTKTQAMSPHKPAQHKSNHGSLVVTNWLLPEELPISATPYMLPETNAMLSWIRTLHDEEYPVQRWSWWQLYLDAVLTIPSFGPWYHVNAKQWRSGACQPSENFQRKARWFSKYLTKLYKSCNVQLPLMHALPRGTSIAFWTATIPVRVSVSKTSQLDQWFGEHFPCASKTSDLRRINM